MINGEIEREQEIERKRKRESEKEEYWEKGEKKNEIRRKTGHWKKSSAHILMEETDKRAIE